MFQFAKILIYVSWFSVLIPIFFLLKRKQNFKNTPIKVLGVLLFTSAFSDSLSYVVIKMGKSNIAITNYFFIVQFFLLSCVYYFLLKNKKVMIQIALVLFTGYFIINALYIQPINEDQSWSRLIGGCIILSYVVIYYRQILKITPPIDLFRFSSFWLNNAIYFYFAFNLFLFAMSNYIFKNMEAEVGIIAWIFHNFNSVIKNILFTVAIYYVGVKQKQRI